jgi:hypothetical protein
MNVIPKLELSQELQEELLSKGFTAARMLGPGTEAPLLTLLPTAEALSNGDLCLELARIYARAEDFERVIEYVTMVKHSLGFFDAKETLDNVEQDPELSRYGDQIKAVTEST